MLPIVPGCGVTHWAVGIWLAAISPKENDSPSLSSHWLPTASLLWVEPWALGRVPPSSMLEFWLVWSFSSCVGSYSCYKFMCSTALPCLEDSPSQLLSSSTSNHVFSVLSSEVSSDSDEGGWHKIRTAEQTKLFIPGSSNSYESLS